MKLLETMGLSRSGHHALLNWILLNLTGVQIEWKYKMTYISNTSIFFLDEANHDIPLSFKFIDEASDKIKLLFVCYEDTFWDYTLFNSERIFKGPYSLSFKPEYSIESIGRFTLIRNFYDTLNSRISANNKNMGKEWVTEKPFYFKTDDTYIKRWKNLAKACIENKIDFIRFEDWKTNKEVRKNFLREVFNIKEIFSIENIVGTKSSFSEEKKVNLIPEQTMEIIYKDTELKELILNLGYEYRSF